MIGVVVASYGDEFWNKRAERARNSVLALTGYVPWVKLHSASLTLHGVRNQAAENLFKNHPVVSRVVFLDADDELDPDFVITMEARIMQGALDRKTIVSPACVYITGGSSRLVVESRPIGCVIPKELFETMGGFEPWPVLEDMAFWTRAELIFGATFATCRNAVYRVHNDVDPEMRRNPPNGSNLSNYWAQEIRRAKGSWEMHLHQQGAS